MYSMYVLVTVRTVQQNRMASANAAAVTAAITAAATAAVAEQELSDIHTYTHSVLFGHMERRFDIHLYIYICNVCADALLDKENQCQPQKNKKKGIYISHTWTL